MNSILQTPHGDLSVVDLAEWRRVEESHGADGGASFALANFLASVECQVFSLKSVDRYKREFAAKRNKQYARFVQQYDPWITWVTNVSEIVGGILLILTAVSFTVAFLGLLAVAPAALFGRPDIAAIAMLGGLSVAIAFLTLYFLGSGLFRAITGGWFSRFRAQGLVTPRIEWRGRKLNPVEGVPTPVTDLVALLQHRFDRSEHSASFRIEFNAEVAVGVLHPLLESEERNVDPFLVVDMVSKKDRSNSSSAFIAVWDEAGFVATLYPPTVGIVSPTV